MKSLAVVFCYNEGAKLRRVLEKIRGDSGYDTIIIDDGSSDESPAIMSEFKIPVVRHEKNLGVGTSMRSAFSYAKNHQYDVILMIAGNGKMDVDHIPRLLDPIVNEGVDYVQGSRYLSGGGSANMPLYRTIMIRIFTGLVNLFMGIRGTDVTCGFRAYRMDIFERAEINIDQEWLGKYEMEYYIHYKVLKKKLKFVEVPITMIYPEERKNYSKIKAGSGWWSMVRPWIFLVLKIKK
ncbi:MAG: glycosyltransferase family 2 protein [Candidatus Zixiibacteriota bacterium]